MEKIWAHEDLQVANIDISLLLTEKGKFQELNDFIEENITAAESKRLLITLRGVTKDASTHPPIFEASVDPNEPLLAQLHLSVDQTAISAEMGTSQVFHQGKLITDADTCAGLQIQAGAQILLAKVEGQSGGKGKRWFRTSVDKITPDSSWYMSTSSRDALLFKAKRDVVVLGFGCTGPRASEHPTQLLGWSHSIQYKANGTETEKVVFTAETPAEIEGALVNLFDVYFSEIGLPDCELAEGQSIDLMQTLNSGPQHFNYISGGDADRRSRIEGQEADFEPEYSNSDGNGTDSSCGQFAYLIYRQK